MSAFFCDTSALVKRYVSETGAAWLISTIHPNLKQRIYIAQITIVEIVSAITRREKGGSTTSQEALIALNQFEQDWKTEITIIDFSANLVNEAVALARKHALRGYDAVQLATVLKVHNERTVLGLSSLVLLSADTELNAAAIAEGLTVDNPNNH
jgi:predicted nucleic acid-binding protein